MAHRMLLGFCFLCISQTCRDGLAAPTSGPARPATHVYQTFGERQLQLAMHYPADWKLHDRRAGVLYFSGAHKVQPDAAGKLPPLADERAKLGLPVRNAGPGERDVPIGESFARLGLVCMRVEYRTRGKDGVLPGEDIADAMAAIRWVRSHAASLGVDPDRVVAAGGSSGAYLAASLFAFEDQHPDRTIHPVSAKPNALILYSPLVDWLEVGSMSESFLVVLNGDKELGARVSPARHWRKDCPPTLVMVGTEEPPFATVRQFAEKWKAEGAPMELDVTEGGKHGFFAQAAAIGKTFARTEAFLRKVGCLEMRKALTTAPSIRKAPGPNDPAWLANGDNKLPKLERVLKTTDNVRAVFRDTSGKQIAEVRDLFHQHTDVGKLVGAGDVLIEFYDKEDKLIFQTTDLKKAVQIKDKK